jgi:regulatory protein
MWHNRKSESMPIITGLREQKHDPERVNVYLDGAFGFGASRLLIVARGIVQGKALSELEIEELRRDDDVERACNAALNLLSYRPRSRGEIETYFRRKGVDLEAAQAALERLERIGLVDDDEFARFWVRNRQTFRPRGVRALRAEMRGKGLSSEVIEGALHDLPDEELSAFDAGVPKLRSYGSLDEREFFRRMVAYLQRRGFAYPAAAAATRRLSAKRGDSPEASDLLPPPEPE